MHRLVEVKHLFLLSKVMLLKGIPDRVDHQQQRIGADFQSCRCQRVHCIRARVNPISPHHQTDHNLQGDRPMLTLL